MSKALEMLQRIKKALSSPWRDTDRVSVTPEGRVKLAQLHRDEVLEIYRVPERMRAMVAAATEDDPQQAAHWAKVRESAGIVIADGSDGYVGDAEHMVEYCRMLVASLSARGYLPDEEVEALNNAHAGFLRRHLRSADDYAPELTDTKARVLAGCRLELHDAQFDQWLQDIDVLSAKCARHEYTRADALAVRAELERVCTSWASWASQTDDPVDKILVEGVRREFDKLTAVAERHSLGPAHLEALEHQWRSYKFNKFALESEHQSAVQVGAMQQYTITALRTADTFCWAPQTTQAVMAAAEVLPDVAAPSVSALGELAQMNRAGWWWFQEPLHVQTTINPGASEPVVALLWRYGLQGVRPPVDFPQLKPDPRLGLWMQPFVMQRLTLNGRVQDVCVPTLAWAWYDGITLADLPSRLRREYARLDTEGKIGDDDAGIEATIAASLTFSKFVLAAAAWLRQKIVVESHGGQGIRQAARQLQREHKLQEMPRVRIVELRRSQYVKREDNVTDSGTGRKLTCRFVVKGFWRNQWYSTRQEHAQIYIESHLRGPENAPLKTSQSVYVVRK